MKMKKTDYKDKNILVFGSGKSGIGSAELLINVGAHPVIYDGNEKVVPAEILSKLSAPEKACCITGKIPEDIMNSLHGVVMSPGVPTDLPLVDEFRKRDIEVTGEIELAFRVSKGTVYAITGTNGKTTTTSLVGEIFKDYHEDTYVVGNIGIPFTSVALDTDDDSMIAAEISSFQLETIDTFRPHVSAILNITEDHLNRHHTMEEYIRVKECITKNQDRSDYCVLNYEDPELRKFGESIKDRVNVVWFSSIRKVEEGLYLDGDDIICGYKNTGKVIDVNELNIIGTHNYENAMAAIAMALCAGIPLESQIKSLKNFKAVPHRIEFVREVDGVKYYNDSKGTNPDAAIKGIKAMKRPTFLIGGGYDKGSDYKPWIEAFEGKVKCLVLEGATKDDIKAQALSCGFPEDHIVMKDNMTEAMEYCAENATLGDAVLLSPACASWGEFDNYEQRGDRFKEFVDKL